MLRLKKLRELDLETPMQPGRPGHLSAASGLVRAGEHLYVVADDEQQLAVFPADSAAPGQLIRLLPGELPDGKSERKAQKPDFEVLARLPRFTGYPGSVLMALGSGSRPQRQSGVLLGLDAHDAVLLGPRLIDLEPLYAQVSARLGPLNIEGAVVTAGRLLLLQRGNKGAGRNACIELSLPAVLHALASSASLEEIETLAIRNYDLGRIGDVPLCFSDGAALPNGDWLFTAVAEDTADSYADGGCVGAAIGLMRADGSLAWVRNLQEPHKVEGIEAWIENGSLRMLLVTDADDAEIPAALYEAAVPLV